MIKVVDGVPEYCWNRRVSRPVDLRELGEVACYRARTMADYLGISPRQLERDFRSSLGVTPKYWLREQRAIRANELICQGGDLSEISSVLGFKRYGHFAREIKAFFGVRPMELVMSNSN